MRDKNIRGRLLLSYLIVGLLNLVVISFLTYSFYNSRRDLIMKRTEVLLGSVRDLTTSKTALALDKYKLNAAILSDEIPTLSKIQHDPAIEAIWLIKNKHASPLYGTKKIPLQSLDALEDNFFYEASPDLFALKISRNNETFIWLYNAKLRDRVFNHKNSLEKSGEVYFGGKDRKITTTIGHPRKIDHPAGDNESFNAALENKSGTMITLNTDKVEVLRSYALFQYDGLEFVVFVEIPTKNMTTALKDVLKDLLIICGTMVGINFLFSIFFTRSMTSKVDLLSKEIQQLNQQKERQTNESAIQVIKVQEEEREKISFTLHDSVGQYLTVLRWGLSEMRLKFPQEKAHIGNLIKTCDDIIHEIRSISHDLMPTLIKDFGCVLAVKDYFEKQKQIVPLDMEFNYSPELEGAHFRREFDVNLYRMVQEFFQNTLKHSGASSLKLAIQIKNHKIELTYYDNGRGMDSKASLPLSLSYRAKLFGGEMTRVNYDKGLGFKVTFNFKDIGYEAN